MGLLILMSLNTIYSAGSTFLLPLLPNFLITNLLFLDNVIPTKLKFTQKTFFYYFKGSLLTPVLDVFSNLDFDVLFDLITYP